MAYKRIYTPTRATFPSVFNLRSKTQRKMHISGTEFAACLRHVFRPKATSPIDMRNVNSNSNSNSKGGQKTNGFSSLRRRKQSSTAHDLSAQELVSETKQSLFDRSTSASPPTSTASASRKSSSAESKSRQMSNGRIYHDREDVHYLMPDDDEGIFILDKKRKYTVSHLYYCACAILYPEIDRIHQQHWILSHAFGSHFEAPVQEALSQGITVLDSACGAFHKRFPVTLAVLTYSFVFFF